MVRVVSPALRLVQILQGAVRLGRVGASPSGVKSQFNTRCRKDGSF